MHNLHRTGNRTGKAKWPIDSRMLSNKIQHDRSVVVEVVVVEVVVYFAVVHGHRSITTCSCKTKNAYIIARHIILYRIFANFERL